jgi:hypothetical protein
MSSRELTHVNDTTPCRARARTGVFRVKCRRANISGIYPSLPDTDTRRAEVKRELGCQTTTSVLGCLHGHFCTYPFRAPKQDMATMEANTTPPTGPNICLPKSRPTVFECATRFLGKTTKYAADNGDMSEGNDNHQWRN